MRLTLILFVAVPFKGLRRQNSLDWLTK